MYRLSCKYRLGNLQVSVKKLKYNLHSQSSSIHYTLLPAVPTSTLFIYLFIYSLFKVGITF